MSAAHTYKANWNRADRADLFGLHFLHMSARRDWIVRHDLAIELSSRTYATQRYEADIDRDRVLEALPAGLLRERDKLIWLPLLRIPSIRSADQRVTQASRSSSLGIPLMPQSEVRRYLGAGLAWLMINRSPRLQLASSTQQALIRNGLRQCLRRYLAIGDPGLDDLRTDSRTWPDEADPDSSYVDWPWIESLFDHQHQFADSYSAGVAECIAYTRLGYLAVVGVDKEDPSPHIGLDLLPAELELDRYAGLRDARRLLGFEPPNGDTTEGVGRRFWYLPKVGFSRLTAPSLYHLEIPLPEIGDLEAVHVQVTTPEDVCISPAVLHHDRRVERRSGAANEIVQSRTGHGLVVPSPLEILHNTLDGADGKLRSRANRQLVIGELDPIATAWQRRILRIDAAQRLTKPTPRRRLRQRMLAPFWPDYRPNRPPAGLPTTTPAASSPTDSTILRKTREMRDGIAELVSYLEVDDRLPTEAEPKLEELVDHEQEMAHLEMTGDDDLRDHVAHFHVNSTESVFHRTTDSRPVVNGIVRASEQGRTGYITLAAIACSTSTLLLALLLVLALVDVSAFNAEAIVALLLVVPGVSVSLVGRVPGDSIRQLVLGRAQRLTAWSLLAPVVAAASLAALFGDETDQDRRVAVASWLPDVTIFRLLAATTIVSLIPTLTTWWNARTHRHQRFNFDAQVLGRLTYRDEVEAAAGGGPTHDEAKTATIDSSRVAELIKPALFQISRPFQRFMVVFTVEEDAPHAFQDALQALEELPNSLDLAPEGDDRPAVVESSLVASVATTGLTMSVVSVDRSRGAPATADRIKQLLKRPRDDSRLGALGFDVQVIEIEDDTLYFNYRSVAHKHYTITGRDGPNGNALTRQDRLALIRSLVGLETDRRRLAYLYCPIRPGDDGDDGTIRVGYTVSPDWRPEDKNLSLELIESAAGCSVDVHRHVADEPGSGRTYDWPTVPLDGAEPHMLLSAGLDDPKSLGPVVEAIARHGAVLEGGTVLTDGGYACRSLRVWTNQPTIDRIVEDLGRDGIRSGRNGSAPGPTAGGGEGTGWYAAGSSTTDPVAERSSDDETRWVMAWIRWRLDVSSGGLARLLEALDTWPTSPATGDWSVAFTNIEFLASRIGDGRVAGKARCRIGIQASPSIEVAARAEEIHRSLEAQLQNEMAEHLVNPRRFIVVDQHEPDNPLTILPPRRTRLPDDPEPGPDDDDREPAEV